MGRPDPEFLVVGHCTKPHGIKGEVVVQSLTDHPESSFAPGVILYPGTGDSGAPDPDQSPLRVEESRPFKEGYLVRFGGVDTRDRAERVRGWDLLRSLADLEPPGDDELFYHELLGLEVVTEAGRSIGTVREVYELHPAELLEGRDEAGRPIMGPFVLDYIVEVDLEARRLVLDPPDGLLDL